MEDKPAPTRRRAGKSKRKAVVADSAAQDETKRKREEMEDSPPAFAFTTDETPSSEATADASMDDAPEHRLFVVVDHATNIGPRYACTLVCARHVDEATQFLDEWLASRGLPGSVRHQYFLREIAYGAFSIKVVSSTIEHEFEVEVDEWSRADRASRRLYVYGDVYAGTDLPEADEVATGALVLAVDAHDAAGILSGALQERKILPSSSWLQADNFEPLPCEATFANVSFGVYPMSTYTVA
jgi:hypothetical protein